MAVSRLMEFAGAFLVILLQSVTISALDCYACGNDLNTKEMKECLSDDPPDDYLSEANSFISRHREDYQKAYAELAKWNVEFTYDEGPYCTKTTSGRRGTGRILGRGPIPGAPVYLDESGCTTQLGRHVCFCLENGCNGGFAPSPTVFLLVVSFTMMARNWLWLCG